MPFWQWALIAVVVIGILLLLYLKVLPKGALGEFAVKCMIKFLGKEYHSVHNLTFNDGEKTVQVDHIIISPYGIFVIETKDYRGKIYGKENSDKFIQYIGKKKNEFYSPIKQNKGHIYSLKKVIGEYKYVSIIVFSGNSKLKVETDTFVNYISRINKYIRKYKEKVISNEQTKEILDKIKSIALKDRKIRKQHIKDIKTRMQSYDEKIANMICPKCGGNLIKRNGKYGEFLGCTNYPKCEFKKNIT